MTEPIQTEEAAPEQGANPKIITLPDPMNNGDPIVVDLPSWAKSEARLAEQAMVTQAKAPELMAFYNRAILDLDRIIGKLELAQQQAVREAEKKKAACLLDTVPRTLRERGLAAGKNPMGSEDLRQAVLAQDEGYQSALNHADYLKALKTLMKNKSDAFLRGFQAVRTICGDQKFSLNLPNRNLSGDSGTAPSGTSATSRVPGFGVARHT